MNRLKRLKYIGHTTHGLDVRASEEMTRFILDNRDAQIHVCLLEMILEGSGYKIFSSTDFGDDETCVDVDIPFSEYWKITK